jgi:hypothetical protein
MVFCGLPVGRRGSARLGGSVGTDHVLKGRGETQPSHKRVHGVAGQKLPARRVGARLKLEDDAHGRVLIHTGQHRRRSGAAASRRHRCFLPIARRDRCRRCG